MNLKDWGKAINKCAVEHGWWKLKEDSSVDVESRSVGEIYMNIASEVSEAWEHWREGNDPVFDNNGKPDGELIELADVIIRILDYCEVKGWDIEMAMLMKHNYNMKRPFRHGGKKA